MYVLSLKNVIVAIRLFESGCDNAKVLTRQFVSVYTVSNDTITMMPCVSTLSPFLPFYFRFRQVS